MCIFCKIVNKEIPAKVVLESDKFLAFEDINPKAKVHVLIIPKEHIESFDKVSGEAMSGLTLFTQEVAKELDINESGYRLITNIGDEGGQEVSHLHFHMLGGEKLSGF
jgi:histidine triad (HIT) family protein